MENNWDHLLTVNTKHDPHLAHRPSVNNPRCVSVFVHVGLRQNCDGSAAYSRNER